MWFDPGLAGLFITSTLLHLGEDINLLVESLVTWEKDKMEANKKGKGKIPLYVDIKKESICFSYIKKGHMNKECTNFLK